MDGLLAGAQRGARRRTRSTDVDVVRVPGLVRAAGGRRRPARGRGRRRRRARRRHPRRHPALRVRLPGRHRRADPGRARHRRARRLRRAHLRRRGAGARPGRPPGLAARTRATRPPRPRCRDRDRPAPGSTPTTSTTDPREDVRRALRRAHREGRDRARRAPGTVAALDAGVHEIGKKLVEEAAESWMAAEHEGHERTAEEITQLLYHAQVLMIAAGAGARRRLRPPLGHLMT